ncbi:hypothetical protein [Peribacillus simplex]|uniref:Uncharacterized protein n=1 Tax=Peribacillus simplex NBRC 15720 = DSM 1321 TaxID=1349754 RepID=A0A223EJ65_9BACI|nr:hypothetical protein [Peribacillus simplex]ASS95253.1 hypothetical protein BS1321_15860 [Peribacillus simplex NBRC 15720 = DSM 1321]MEC1397931.1 hypothetical protein [Peribacillus simplex]MED3984101.1 hypothetical protein [Peribacillus simplex]MED4092563.1 hypothetical protein [Peribacillus simplex]
MGVFFEKILGLFFEKRKQSKKDFFLIIFIFALSIFNMVEYITDMDLFWLSDIVLIGIIVLSASIYFEGKRNRENDN